MTSSSGERRRAARGTSASSLRGGTEGRLLPDTTPVLPGFEIVGALYPAEFAAGDCFGYLSMPDGSLGFVTGDVTGHGFAPALIMAVF